MEGRGFGLGTAMPGDAYGWHAVALPHARRSLGFGHAGYPGVHEFGNATAWSVGGSARSRLDLRAGAESTGRSPNFSVIVPVASSSGGRRIGAPDDDRPSASKRGEA